MAFSDGSLQPADLSWFVPRNAETVLLAPAVVLSARDQLGALACASVGRCGAGSAVGRVMASQGHVVLGLLRSRVAATAAKFVVVLEGMHCEELVSLGEGFWRRGSDNSSVSVAFCASPELLGIVGRVELRPLLPEWIDYTHFVDPRNCTLYGTAWAPSHPAPRIELDGVAVVRGDRLQIMTERTLEGPPMGFGRQQSCHYGGWVVECGHVRDDEENRLSLLLRRTLPSASSPDCGPVAVIPTPYYTKRNHFAGFIAFNKLAPNEILMVVPLTADGACLLLIDSRKTYTSKLLSVIGSTCFKIGKEERLSEAFHIPRNPCTGQQPPSESTSSSAHFHCRGGGVFILLAKRCTYTAWGHEKLTSEVWRVEETSGSKQVLVSSNDNLNLSWMCGSKFIICHTTSDEPRYEVWDLWESTAKPQKVVPSISTFTTKVLRCGILENHLLCAPEPRVESIHGRAVCQ
ncbi:hypothetical protein Pelo_12654 [Pelomyxa schiedti]|nr:hypothetical protein Pelo_12654 [Pelomyxa schiedti]